MTTAPVKGFLSVLLLLCFSLWGGLKCYGQAIVVKGYVIDAGTNEPIEYATVFFPGTSIGTSTNAKGYFELHSPQPQTRLQISSVGYQTTIKNVTSQSEQTFNVKLAENVYSEVVIASKKKRYRNKNNPAVDLIRLVIDHKNKNRLESYDYAQYEQYEKLEMSLIDTRKNIHDNVLLRRYKFLVDNLDTQTVKTRALLPFYLQEEVADVYYRKKPEKTKTIVIDQKRVDFKKYVDNEGLNVYLKYIYEDINLYDNDIPIMTNRFLSPISDVAPTFYKFWITDTIKEDNVKLVELSFTPRSKTDMLFQGKIYITLDSNYAVKKADLEVNKEINLNWVKGLHVTQEFSKAANGKYYLSKSDLTGSFGFNKRTTGGIYGERQWSIKNFEVNIAQPDTLYKGEPREYAKSADSTAGRLVKAERPDTTGISEETVYQSIDSLQKTRSFRRAMDIGNILLSGYTTAGPVEIGPVSTFYSFNDLEGSRLRFGGRTNTTFSKRYYLEGYGAYGFKDEKFKYFANASYSFSNTSIYVFPVNRLSVNYLYDVKIPGQELSQIQEGSLLLSFKRGVSNKFIYDRILNVDYLKEYTNHISFQLGMRNTQQEPADALQYIKLTPKTFEIVPKLITTEAYGMLRWAPHEKFYQGKVYRAPIPNPYPIFTLREIAGISGIMNSQFNYQNTMLTMYKRFYNSQLGYTDIQIEGSYIFGQLPFPLLDIHRANQSYAFQFQSFNLMNFLEFVSDHYASLYMDHCFNGFFLNKIPAIKKLRWREYLNVKVLYGGLRDENQPEKNLSLMQFPRNENGQASTFSLNHGPYIEGSAGIGNIFNFFRVDLVRRFTYLSNPNVSPYGVRVSAMFDF